MFNFDEHLRSGELTDSDGRAAEVFAINSNYLVDCQRLSPEDELVMLLVFDKRSELNLPVAATYFTSDEDGITIDSRVYTHEPLSGRFENPLFLLQADLAFRIRNELLGIPEGHDEDLPEKLTIIAGKSESEVNEVIEWLSSIFLIEDKFELGETRRNDISPTEYAYRFNEFEDRWEIILQRNIINRIADISASYLPPAIVEILYEKIRF